MFNWYRISMCFTCFLCQFVFNKSFLKNYCLSVHSFFLVSFTSMYTTLKIISRKFLGVSLIWTFFSHVGAIFYETTHMQWMNLVDVYLATIQCPLWRPRQSLMSENEVDHLATIQCPLWRPRQSLMSENEVDHTNVCHVSKWTTYVTEVSIRWM